MLVLKCVWVRVTHCVCVCVCVYVCVCLKHCLYASRVRDPTKGSYIIEAAPAVLCQAKQAQVLAFVRSKEFHVMVGNAGSTVTPQPLETEVEEYTIEC